MSTFTTSTKTKVGGIDFRGLFPTWTMRTISRDNVTAAVRFVAHPCWEVAKYSPKGARFVWQKSRPVVMDLDGRAKINAHTRTIRNRKAAAADLAEGSAEQLAAIAHELRTRKSRRNARIIHRARLAITGGAIVGAESVAFHHWPEMPWMLDALALGGISSAGIGSLGLIGRRVDGGARALGLARRRSISDELLREVLSNLGIPALAQKVNEVRPVSLTVENKTHFSTTLRLPMSVNVTQVQNKHEMFSGNLDVNPDCLILERGESASRLIVKVSKVSPSNRKQGQWEIPKTTDIFGDIVIGENVIGETMSIQIPASLLAFGKTGWGKSVFLRLVIANALSDPLVQFRLLAAKGLGDFKVFADLSADTVAGHASSNEIAEQGFEWLRRMNAVSAYRTDILSDLGEPEVTRELAEQYPELRPIVGVADEIGLLFQNQQWGKEAKAEMLKLLSNIRAQGIRLISATQMFNNVIDSKFPGAFTNVAVFKTSQEWEGRTILGDDADAQGLKPFHFKAKGEVITKDADEVRHRLRVFPVTNQQMLTVAKRAAKERGGVVAQIAIAPMPAPVTSLDVIAIASPEVAKPAPVSPTAPTMDHIAAVVADVPLPKLQSQQILERLQDVFKNRYDGATAADVTNTLREQGITIIPNVHKKDTLVDGVKKPTTRPGVSLDDIRKLVKAA